MSETMETVKRIQAMFPERPVNFIYQIASLSGQEGRELFYLSVPGTPLNGEGPTLEKAVSAFLEQAGA